LQQVVNTLFSQRSSIKNRQSSKEKALWWTQGSSIHLCPSRHWQGTRNMTKAIMVDIASTILAPINNSSKAISQSDQLEPVNRINENKPCPMDETQACIKLHANWDWWVEKSQNSECGIQRRRL